MAPHARETSYELRIVIATCRLLYGEKYDAIERKTGLKSDTARRIMQRAIARSESSELIQIIECLKDWNRPGRPPRIEKGSELSSCVREAALKHPELKPIAAVDKENIQFSQPGMKRQNRPARSTIERVLHRDAQKTPTGAQYRPANRTPKSSLGDDDHMKS